MSELSDVTSDMDGWGDRECGSRRRGVVTLGGNGGARVGASTGGSGRGAGEVVNDP